MIIVSYKGSNYRRYVNMAGIRKIHDSFFALKIPNAKDVNVLEGDTITIDGKNYDVKFINENFDRVKAIIENESNKYLLEQL